MSRLAQDEQVLLRLRPHGRALLRPVLVLLAALALAGYAAASVPAGSWQAAGRWAVGALTALVVLRWAAVPWLRWLATVVVVTDRRVRWQCGVLRRTTRDVPLSRVADVAVERSLGQRLVGSGTLVLATAGERGALVVRDVRAPYAVADRLCGLVDEAPGAEHEHFVC